MRQLNTKARVGIALVVSFLITGLYFAIVYRSFPIVYEINDDVAMRNVAAGVITGEPDAHLMFVKYLLGLVIAGLYRAIPGFDWYGITMIGTILFSFAMVLYRGFVSAKSALWKASYTGLVLLFFTCVGLQHIVAFQFTVVAAFAGAAGIFLFYTAESEDKFQIVLEEGISVFLLLLCLLVRESVFIMVLPMAALCFWAKYGTFDFKKKFPVVLKHLAVPITLFAGIVLIMGVEKVAYDSDEWETFLDYNSDRASIMDYYGLLNYEENAEFYDSMALTPEEVENLQRYSLYLTDEVYPEKMHELAVNAKEMQLQPYSLKDQIFMGAKKVYDHFRDEGYAPAHVISFILMAGTLIFSLLKDKKQFLVTLALCAVMGVLWLYLGYKGRIVDRVGYAMYLVTSMSMLAVGYRLLFTGSNKKGSKWLNSFVVIAVCAVLTVLAGQKIEAVKERMAWRFVHNQEFLEVNHYMAEHPENVYFMTTFSIETYTDNFTIHRDFDFSNLLSVGGWHTFSPLENVKCEKLGITESKKDIVETQNVYVISLEAVNLRYMDRFYTSVYGEDYLGRELIETLNYGGNNFEVYDFEIEE